MNKLSAQIATSLVLILLATAPAAEMVKSSKTKGKHDWLTKHPTILKLLKSTNEERKRNGLSELKLNTKLCLAAQKHAVWMAETGYYQHSDLPWPEIIHSGPQTPEDAVSGWIYSPAHYGILLSGDEVGFGYMINGGSTYWVGVFQ
jgi:uncharacterized protein YkwD